MTVKTPEKGVLVRKPSTCDECFLPCVIGGNYTSKSTPGYYTFYNKKLCKVCAKDLKVC